MQIKQMRSISSWRVAILLLTLLATGCATLDGSVSRSSVEVETKPAGQEKQEIVRPAKPTRIATDDELGFTITERVRIAGDVRDAYSEALRLLKNGDSAAGIAGLEAVIAQAPELTAPYIDLGVAYSQAGDFEKAETNLQHALQLTPDHPVAHNELGIVYRRTGRFALARQSYENALRILPDFYYAQRNLGVLCDLFLQDLQCALSNYQAYQQIFPDDREVSIWIADIENRVGSVEGPQ